MLKILTVTTASASTLLLCGFVAAWVMYVITANEAWITAGVWSQLLAGGTAGYSLWAYSYASDDDWHGKNSPRAEERNS